MAANLSVCLVNRRTYLPLAPLVRTVSTAAAVVEAEAGVGTSRGFWSVRPMGRQAVVAEEEAAAVAAAALAAAVVVRSGYT